MIADRIHWIGKTTHFNESYFFLNFVAPCRYENDQEIVKLFK